MRPLPAIRHHLLIAGAILCLAGTASATTWDALTARRMTPRVMPYKTIGETELKLRIYDTREAIEAPRPAILLIHGGGWSSPGHWLFEPHSRYFAERGMVAINVEYRLVGDEPPIRMGDCIADIRDAFAFVQREAETLGIDPERIALAGDSAGGHLAAAIALVPPADPDAATDLANPGALLVLNAPLELETIPWMRQHKALAPRPDEADTDEAWLARARHYSPITHVRPDLPPTLLIHGDADTVVAVDQSERFARALRQHRNSVKVDRMPGWAHAFALEGYGTERQIAETLITLDRFLAGLGWLEGDPAIRPVLLSDPRL